MLRRDLLRRPGLAKGAQGLKAASIYGSAAYQQHDQVPAPFLTSFVI